MENKYISNQMNELIWPNYVKRFKAGTSVESYRSGLEEFCLFMKKDFLMMESEDVSRFYEYLSRRVKDGELKSSTMAKKFRELHSIANYIKSNRDVFVVPDAFDDFFYLYLLDVAEVAKEANTIPPEHVELLFKAAAEDTMVYAIMALMVKVGLKSSELAQLKVSDLAEYDNGVFAYITARKEACSISEDAASIISDFLEVSKLERPVDHDYLFFNTKGNALNVMYISRMMKKYCTLAGIPQYSANTLRAACAANMFLYDISKNHIAHQMGVTKKHIIRYNGRVYKDQMMSAVNRMVKVHVELPD